MSRHCPPEAYSQQQSIRINERSHTRRVPDANGTGPTRLPQAQCSESSHLKLQGILPQRPCRSRRQLSLHLWERLLPQTKITINLLRQSNATPTVSAYAHLSGPFDCIKMPLEPVGSAVQIHKKTDKRGTWAYQSVDGWYIATSPEHYRTLLCYVKSTKSERFTNTAQFSHKHITCPTWYMPTK